MLFPELPPSSGPAFAGPQLAVFAIRVLVGALPWGDAANQLPYEPSDLGATEAAAPTKMIALAGGRFWLLDGQRGTIHLAHPSQRTCRMLDLRQAAREHLPGISPVAFTMARGAGDQLMIVIGGRAHPLAEMQTLLGFFSADGAPRHWLSPQLPAGTTPVPASVGLTAEGHAWLVYPQQALLFDLAGKQVTRVDAPGIVLHDGAYLTREAKPRLFGPAGDLLGVVEARWEEPIFFLTAGPGDVLVAPYLSEELPERLHAKLHLMDVYRLDRTFRRIELHDRIAFPAVALQPAHGQEPADGLPVKSYFPPRSLAFEPSGDLWVLEHVPTECRFHVFRQLREGDDWPDKFTRLNDLNAEELELYRAEAHSRLKLFSEAGELGQTYAKMQWLIEDLPLPNAVTRHTLLRSLREARPAPDRD